jgi:hypothetical protein
VRVSGLRAAYGDMICTRGTSCGGYRDPADPVLLDLDGTVTQGAGHDVCAVVHGRPLSPTSATVKRITRRTVLEPAAEARVRSPTVGPAPTD